MISIRSLLLGVPFTRRFNKFIGWTDIFVIILLSLLALKLITVRVQAQTIKRRIVYNYDPTSQMVEELNSQGQRISKLEGRVEDISQGKRDDKKIDANSNFEGRLAKLEASQDIMKQLLIAILIAVILMLIETAQRRLTGKKPE